MIMCPKCGKALEDGTRFCDNCGAQIPEAAVCPNCGEKIIPGYAFCQKCGAPVSQAPNPGAGYVPNPGAGYVPNPGTGYTPDPGAGYAPNPGAGYVPNPGTGYTSDPGAGYAPNPGAGYAPNPGAGYTPDPGAGYAPDPGTGYAPNPGAGYAPNPGTGYAPDPGAGYASYPDSGAGNAPAAVKQKKPIPKKALIFGGIGVAAVAVVVAIVALIVNLVGGGDKAGDKTYMFYLKDREIVYLDLKSGDKLDVTSKLLNGSMSDYNLANSAYALGYYIAFNADSSRIFYPDRTDFNNAQGVTLYYRNMNSKKDEEPVKIDSDITSYAINDAGTLIIYSKGSDGNLYKHDLTNKEKIASDVEYFNVADDCKKILYRTEDGSIYLWYADKDKVKLASDISSLSYVSPDLSVIYYIKDEALYKQVEGAEDREKVAADVFRVVNIYESGEVYYVKSEDVEINLMDYVNDDMAASDAAITEPMYVDYQHPDAPESIYWRTNYNYGGDYPREDYPYYYYDYTDSYWGEAVYVTQTEYDAWWTQYNADTAAWQAECDRLDNEYQQAREAYWAKQNRDYLRESLNDYSFTQTEYALYYYNGTEETIVTDALASAWDITYASGSATMLLKVYNQSEVARVRISEIENGSYEVYERVYAALYSTSERYVAVKATLSVFDQTEADYFRIASDGSAIYFLDEIVDHSKGELYKITVTDGQASRPELYDSDVSTSSMYFLSDNRFMYYKDVDESSWKGDLYVDKTNIDYDVRVAMISTMGDAFLYYTDWNNDRSYGTLKMYNNGEKTKVADDVHAFSIVNGNDILYLYDYSSSSYKGTLYRYNQGEPVKIDEDVMGLIPVSGSKIKGNFYYYNW